MSRSLLLKAAAALAVVAALAACDTPSGALGPRNFRPAASSHAVADSTSTRVRAGTMSDKSPDDPT